MAAVNRIVPNLVVSDLREAVTEHQAALDLTVLMDHGWIVTLGDDDGHQLSLMTRDATGPVNPSVSIFVDDVDEAPRQVQGRGLEVVYPRTDEPWGVTRFFYRDSSGNVVNVGMHTLVE
ncbi:VOC family protein [Gordonia sp. DT218]